MFRRKPEPEPAPIPSVFEVLEGHPCAGQGLPQAVYGTPFRPYAACPSCKHALAVHTFADPCPLCVLEVRWGALALEHLHCRRES